MHLEMQVSKLGSRNTRFTENILAAFVRLEIK